MGIGVSAIYKKLYAHFGPQRWWPADTPFEMMVGAILTQNTSWKNVEKAIANLRKNKALLPKRLRLLSERSVASLIRPAGYYNIKAKRLKNFVRFFAAHFNESVRRMKKVPRARLRHLLLSVNGIGQETADSILLYALGKPVFVVDAYTRRILSRHRLIKEEAGYDEVQKFFMKNLQNKVQLFNEYHALLVKLGKDFCLKKNPKCEICPLGDLL